MLLAIAIWAAAVPVIASGSQSASGGAAIPLIVGLALVGLAAAAAILFRLPGDPITGPLVGMSAAAMTLLVLAPIDLPAGRVLAGFLLAAPWRYALPPLVVHVALELGWPADRRRWVNWVLAWYGIQAALLVAAAVGLLTTEAPLIEAVDGTIRPLLIEPAAAVVAILALGTALLTRPRPLFRRAIGWGLLAVMIGFLPSVIAAIIPAFGLPMGLPDIAIRLTLLGLPVFGAMAVWVLPYRDAAARDRSAQQLAIAFLDAAEPPVIARELADALRSAVDARAVLVRTVSPECTGSSGELSDRGDDAVEPGSGERAPRLTLPIGRAAEPLGEVVVDAGHGDAFGTIEREWLAAWLVPLAVVLRARRREEVAAAHRDALATHFDHGVSDIARAAQALPLAPLNAAWAVPPTVDAREVLAQLSDNVTGIARHGEGLQMAAAEARDRARSSSDAVARSIDRLAALSAEIARLATHGDAIAASNETVSGVAFRTNLVANNAALEATRAGPAGRTFGVLAEEVRRLADTTAATSVAIGERTGALAADIGGLHAAIEATRHALGDAIREAEVGESAAQRMGDSAAELEDIARALGPVVNEASSVAKRRSARDQHLTGMMERLFAERAELARALTAHREAMERLATNLHRAQSSLAEPRGRQ
ncbi:MAG TPA: methyl-accepting chemotaxis protein [Gemmatimonadales bacterium]